MKDIKDYREKELKQYATGNILVMLIFSGCFNIVYEIFTQYLQSFGILMQSPETEPLVNQLSGVILGLFTEILYGGIIHMRKLLKE